jgi:autotransporter strand-loop-strand O-heptosyltransferase
MRINEEELSIKFKVDNLQQIQKNPNNSNEDHILFNFISNGPRCEIHGFSGENYIVTFIDKDKNETFCSTTIRSAQYIEVSPQYYVNWNIIVVKESNNETILNFHLNLANKNVLISFESSAMGDTLAWMHTVENFRKHWNCNLICSTFHNDLISPMYPNITFVPKNQPLQGIHFVYKLGWFGSGHQSWRNPINCQDLPMEQIAYSILGNPYIKSRNFLPQDNRPPLIKGKYVVMTDSSTAQFKHWNLEGGWQKLIDWYNKRKIQVVNIGKMPNHYKGVIDVTGQRNMTDIINVLQYGEYFIGLGSGLSWLNHYIKDNNGNPKKTILISGMSMEWCEFEEDCYRLINKNVCHGCFNDNTKTFNKADWFYCPLSENPMEKFQCSKKISVDSVIKAATQLESDMKNRKFYTSIQLF